MCFFGGDLLFCFFFKQKMLEGGEPGVKRLNVLH